MIESLYLLSDVKLVIPAKQVANIRKESKQINTAVRVRRYPSQPTYAISEQERSSGSIADSKHFRIHPSPASRGSYLKDQIQPNKWLGIDQKMHLPKTTSHLVCEASKIMEELARRVASGVDSFPRCFAPQNKTRMLITTTTKVAMYQS